MKKKLLALLFSLATLTLVACGGGGAGVPSNPTATTPVANYATLPTPAGVPCLNSTALYSTVNLSNTDAFGNVVLRMAGTSHGSAKPYSCMVVDQANNQPVFSGNQSVRFESRPGDCFVGVGGYDDCANDRQHNDLQAFSTDSHGKIITYEYAIYIPTQPMIQPPPELGKAQKPLTVLTQINWQCLNADPCSNLGGSGYGALAYLLVDHTGKLFVWTHSGFTWTPNPWVVIDAMPQDKWIKLKYVIKSTANADGYLQIYANDRLIVNETRATLPNIGAILYAKPGIYNAFISSSAAWQTQVVYFDGFNTSVTKF